MYHLLLSLKYDFKIFLNRNIGIIDCCEVNKRRVVYSELNFCVLIYPDHWIEYNYIECNSGNKSK